MLSDVIQQHSVRFESSADKYLSHQPGVEFNSAYPTSWNNLKINNRATISECDTHRIFTTIIFIHILGKYIKVTPDERKHRRSAQEYPEKAPEKWPSLNRERFPVNKNVELLRRYLARQAG